MSCVAQDGYLLATVSLIPHFLKASLNSVG